MTCFVQTQKCMMGKGKGSPKLKQSRCNSSIQYKPHGFQQLYPSLRKNCLERTLLCKAIKYFCSQISEEDYFDLYYSKFPLNEENIQQSYQNQPKSVISTRHLVTLSPSLSLQILCLKLHYGKVDNLSHLVPTS